MYCNFQHVQRAHKGRNKKTESILVYLFCLYYNAQSEMLLHIFNWLCETCQFPIGCFVPTFGT